MKKFIGVLLLAGGLAATGCGGVPEMTPGAIVVQSDVLDLAVSRDGSKMAIGSSDMQLKVYRTKDGFQWADLKGHEGGVWGVAFSSDGKQLASVASDSSVRFWDVETSKELWKASPGGYSVALSWPDDKTVAVGSDYKIRLLSSKDGITSKELKDESGNVMAVTYSSDGTRLASGSQVVRYWDMTNGSELWSHNAPGVKSLGISNFQVLAASSTGVFSLQLRDGKQMKMSPVSNGEPCVSADGKLSAEPTSSGVNLRDMTNDKVIARANAFPARQVALSADGRVLVVATDKDVRVFTR